MTTPMTRRRWLQRLGRHGGSAAVLAALNSLGLAQASPASADFKLGPAPTRGRRVLVLGAGVAGLVSALELQRAGYQVQLLEYNQRPGGRCWTLRGGDRYTELGGASQLCQFDRGQYFNPGPWRIPFNHHGVLSYCRQLGVALQPFVQINDNAYLHSRRAFGGKPQRRRELQADFSGEVDELLAKVLQQHQLDAQLSNEDQARLLETLRHQGALDREYRYRASDAVAERRGFEPFAGRGVSSKPPLDSPRPLTELLGSGLLHQLEQLPDFEYQSPLFQPVGGMDMIAQALARAVGPRIRYGARVSAISQDERGVSVAYEDLGQPGRQHTASADWCVCTLPLSVLSQTEMRISPALREAIDAAPYFSALKVGLQFKRRFWEEDEGIYGGITSTDMPNRLIAYPSHDFHGKKGVLLGAYAFGTQALEFTALPPAKRIQAALRFGAQIHPQYPAEFETGMAVGWHRSPTTLGCFAFWSQANRERHYPTLLKMDGRLILAGEHASLLPAWQEGAVLSARHAVTQLHAAASSQTAK
ncbi:flavin monoamine oxidase family protein [Paucibacter sp. APW11]|uniref:Tryptophan 2-monooxygenase n=1 Tax=Roseateles aquae TaxID=3077235 RepID=A0ABU3PIL5_9BURK|nr:flavin monoamine oxidase family protein [Paucibacter sp. APW11]MDT9002406.1 flavin monoamine oxidase family protein [Paucibacter sp. APW11]